MKSISEFLIAGLLLIGILQCNGHQAKEQTGEQQEKMDTTASPPNYSLDDIFSSNPLLEQEVKRIINELSTEEKIAQMVVGLAGELGYPKKKVLKLIQDYGIGCVAILKGSAQGIRKEISEYQLLAESSGVLPLLVSTDAEPYLINKNISGIPPVPETDRISHPAVSRAVSKQIAEILGNLNVHVNYAPVCDFSKNRSIINRRSFGDAVEQVTQMASVFSEGLQENGIVATAKHFPGHGMVEGDTHKNLVFLRDSFPELEVFRNVINRGVISVMIGHIAVLDHPEYSTGGKPATLSRRIVTDLLKDSLGFQGIAITDAMNMHAVDGFSRPSLQAFKAGCDMIITPASVPDFIEQVRKTVEKEPQYMEQLNASVEKIVRLKICTGLIKTKPQLIN